MAESTIEVPVVVIHVDEGVHEVALLAAAAARDVCSSVDKTSPGEAAASVVDAYIAAARKLVAGDSTITREDVAALIERSNARFERALRESFRGAI